MDNKVRELNILHMEESDFNWIYELFNNDLFPNPIPLEDGWGFKLSKNDLDMKKFQGTKFSATFLYLYSKAIEDSVSYLMFTSDIEIDSTLAIFDW
jgi:hypothetical protein